MMMKLSLAVVLVILAAESASGGKVCRATNGKRIITFSRTTEMTKFPCKYNAVRNTVCGDWRVTVSPGNTLETARNKLYVIKTMWVGVENVRTQLSWEGRSDLKIARKYLAGLEDAPFRKKRGSLKTSDVFKYGDVNADNEVSLTEKNDQFKITFGLYEPYGSWHKSSGFKFQCFSDTFEPTDYPTQLCGNGTKREVKAFKKSHGWKEYRMATLFYNVFSNEDIVQTHWDCIGAARSMQKQCKTPEERYNAAKLCWPILGKPQYQRCYSRHGDSPIGVFRDCVEYMCTGDPDPCLSLGPKLDMCPDLSGVSSVVRDDCFPNLYVS